jgi:hypothetical protein
MKYLGTAVGCALMLVLTVPRYGGFLLGLFLIFLIPLFAYSGVRMMTHATERKLRGAKLAIWVLAIGVVLGVNFYRYSSTRGTTNDVVAKMVEYHQMHSVYPDSLEAIGYDRRSLNEILGMHGYSNTNGKPAFFYGVPYQIYDAYKFDFTSKQWVYSEAS